MSHFIAGMPFLWFGLFMHARGFSDPPPPQIKIKKIHSLLIHVYRLYWEVESC